MIRTLLFATVFGASAAAAAPQATPATPATPAAVTELDAIVVTGEVPGPGLWRVERDGHVLWVLATVSPLPRRIEWNGDEVVAKIAGSGVVLLPPRVDLKAEGVRFGGVFLLPALLRARNNPGKETLADVLPPPDFARWRALKARYLGRDRGVEKRRPLLAAMDLREAALKRHDLSTRDVVGRVVERAARRADVPLQRPTVTRVIADAKAALKSFAGDTLDDVPCFRLTLAQVEHDLGTLADRANAWSLGDVAALRALPYTDFAQSCRDALLGTDLAKAEGLDDLPERVAAAWLADAEAAIATHPTSFAVLPLDRVDGPASWLAPLQARGYAVHPPGEAPSGD